jgi:hypothetical protein
MTTWTRGVLWVVWLAAVGWLWAGGSLGTGAALAAGVLSLLLFALPGAVRRRRSGLQYVEMGKEPVGLLLK